VEKVVDKCLIWEIKEGKEMGDEDGSWKRGWVKREEDVFKSVLVLVRVLREKVKRGRESTSR
jgi:hypothetical protein